MSLDVRGLSAGLALLALSAQAAVAASLAWTFDNQTDTEISLEFYSQDRDHDWPGDDRVYLISPTDGARTYVLSCNRGENICYGGWIMGDRATYWGRGYNDQQSCPDCCAICGGGIAEPVDLVR